MFEIRHRLTFVAAALLFVGFAACSSPAPRNSTGGSGGEEETGGSTGSTGGKTGSTGGKTGSTGGSTGSTGGSTGSTGGSTGSTGGTTGSTGGSSGDTGGAGGSTGGAGGSTGGAGGATGGAGGAMGTGGTGGAAGGAVLACWVDPKVIKICHQLENACENCGPMKGVAPPKNTKAQPCFDLVNKAYMGMATDADCEKHAIDNDCTVDNVATTGNVCGSLECTNAACSGKFGGKTCEEAKGWGDSSICKQFYAKCPCK